MARPNEPDRARRALDAAEHQRRIIAQRLHDEAIPTLLTAAQDLRDARAALPDQPPAALEAIDRAAELLALSVTQLRRTAIDLRPVSPVRLDLGESVALLAVQAAEVGHLRCNAHVDPDAAVADVPAAVAIIRELLANVVRHAKARSASVEVIPIPGRLSRIIVADDGIGLSQTRVRRAVAEGHIGLSLVAERVDELGGRFNLARNAERGTTVTIELPALDR